MSSPRYCMDTSILQTITEQFCYLVGDSEILANEIRLCYSEFVIYCILSVCNTVLDIPKTVGSHTNVVWVRAIFLCHCVSNGFFVP